MRRLWQYHPKMYLPFKPAILLLGIYPTGTTTLVQDVQGYPMQYDLVTIRLEITLAFTKRLNYGTSTQQTVCFAQLCLTLCDPMDCSLPGSSIHGIYQARILGWIAIPPPGGSSRPRDQTHISYVSYLAVTTEQGALF